MAHLTKVAGTWRNSKPYTKVAGTWKLADYVYNKVGGRWYTSFVKGGLVDKSWDDRDQTGQFGAPWQTSVRDMAIQSDGKILLGGQYFTSWNGVALNGFLRLNANGTLDTEFNNNLGTGFNSVVYSVIPQSDGKTLIGGGFATLNAVAAAGLVRLNSDGTRDATLDTATGINFGNIYGAAIQSDGKIVIGGSFTAWKGVAANYFTRINANGALDTAFNNNLGTGPNGAVLSVKVQSDGKIIVAGQFSTWNGVTVANNIVRLETTGVRDTAFTINNGTGTGLSQTIQKVAIQSDGKILLGGVFTTWNGTTVGRIVRLNSDGTRDTAFTTNNGTGANNTIYSIAIQSDGKIVIGGVFTAWNGTTVGRIVRLNSDGTLDADFTTNNGTGINNAIYSIAIQSDGKIIVAGQFSSFNSVYVGTIFRLNSNGTNSETLSAFANSTVNSIAIQSDGKIVVGGTFTTWNGTTVGRIVRLNADGTLDAAFMSNIGAGATSSTINKIVVRYDGKIFIVGAFTVWNGASVGRFVCLNSDGTVDTAFMANVGTGAVSNSVLTIAIDYLDRIVLGGSFTSWNGMTSYRIVRLNTDGTRDNAFTIQTGGAANSAVNSVVTVDDKIIVGGDFTYWDGTAVGRIVRLNDNGSRDTAFTTNTGTGANSGILVIATDPDQRILIGGYFTTWNGTIVRRFARLNANGSLDTAFTTNTGSGANSLVYAIAVQSDGKILLGGQFTAWNDTTVGRIVRLESTGTIDTAFTGNNGAGANSIVYSFAIQSDKKILVGGSFVNFGVANEFRRFFVRIGGEDAS